MDALRASVLLLSEQADTLVFPKCHFEAYKVALCGGRSGTSEKRTTKYALQIIVFPELNHEILNPNKSYILCPLTVFRNE